MKVALYGAGGRMGCAIARLIAAADDSEIVGAVDHHDAPTIGRDIGELAGLGTLGVEVSPDLNIWRPIEADPNLLAQVLVNLAANARDAMAGGGQVRIVARAADSDVVLEVHDDGCGMDEETVALSIEPFFTTKPADRGTGLGLAVVYGIVEQFGGTLEVDSAEGVGTCVRMRFPGLDRTAAPVAERAAKAGSGAGPRGVERILVLEDQPSVRSFLAAGLRRYGYDVLEAATGDEALAAASGAEPPIDLFLSDVRVPGGSGPETVSALVAERPGLRVLYMSGYTDAPRDASGRMPDGFDLLAKPFSLERLAKRVRELLDAPAAAASRPN